MAGFDERKIPTLDDIIEVGDNEKIDFNLSIDSDEMLDAEAYTAEVNLNLFTSEAVNSTTEDPIVTGSISNIDESTFTENIIEGTIYSETEPQIGAADNVNNKDENSNSLPLYAPVEVNEDKTDTIESALLNYNIADEEETEPSTADQPAIHAAAGTAEVESQTTASLQTVADDIVKQLMPELEQQLRLLLEQALKEKFPEKISQTEI